MSDGVRIWTGKAKRRQLAMEYRTYKLIYLLNKLKLVPDEFDGDWEEVFRCYVYRILNWKE